MHGDSISFLRISNANFLHQTLVGHFNVIHLRLYFKRHLRIYTDDSGFIMNSYELFDSK